MVPRCRAARRAPARARPRGRPDRRRVRRRRTSRTCCSARTSPSPLAQAFGAAAFGFGYAVTPTAHQRAVVPRRHARRIRPAPAHDRPARRRAVGRHGRPGRGAVRRRPGRPARSASHPVIRPHPHPGVPVSVTTTPARPTAPPDVAPSASRGARGRGAPGWRPPTSCSTSRSACSGAPSSSPSSPPRSGSYRWPSSAVALLIMTLAGSLLAARVERARTRLLLGAEAPAARPFPRTWTGWLRLVVDGRAWLACLYAVSSSRSGSSTPPSRSPAGRSCSPA